MKSPVFLAVVLLAVMSPLNFAQGELPSGSEVLKEAGVSAGLAVVVGTTDGKLEAELTNGGQMLVQGLAISDDAAAKARQHLFAQKLYGLASVARVQSARTLPYYDRIVNLLVADLDALGKDAPAADEIRRVLGYEGVAYLKQDGKWSKTVKPTPKEVDTWTHAYYDPSCSKVSRDLLAGPANALRWINGPAGLRNGTGAPRTSDGVFVQIVPETREGGKGTSLLARDVNSGVLLWKKAGLFMANEFLVAIGGRVYTCQRPQYTGKGWVPAAPAGQSNPAPPPLRGWNIRTGKLEKTYEAGLQMAPKPGQNGLCQVLVIGGDLVQVSPSEIRVLDTETGQLRWKKEGSFHRAAAGGSTIFLSLAKPDQPEAGPGQRFTPAVRGVAVTALDLASGKPLWTKEARDFKLESLDPNEAILRDLWYDQGKLAMQWSPRDPRAVKTPRGCVVLLDAAKATQILAHEAGEFAKTDFSEPRSSRCPVIIGNELWYANATYGATVFDLATAKVKRKVSVPYGAGCLDSSYTPNWAIFSSLYVPVDRDGPQAAKYAWYRNHSMRGSCGELVAPSYGAVHHLGNKCFCEAFLPGNFSAYALAPTVAVADAERLAVGAALGGSTLGPVEPQAAASQSVLAEDWAKEGWEDQPNRWFRAGGRRNNRDSMTVWMGYQRAKTQPVAAGDLTLTAFCHEHRLAAVRGGKEIWNFVAGGRISSPPVVHQGRAFFASHDGYVYAVNLADGAQAWRFLAGPADRRHVAFGQVESAFPVFNVLLHEGNLVFSAGRHWGMDGGIHVYALDPATGALRWHTRVIRGLSTDKLTPEHCRFGQPRDKNEVWTKRSFYINDATLIKDDKLLVHDGTCYPWASGGKKPEHSVEAEHVICDLANPKDIIINEETIAPPGIR